MGVVVYGAPLSQPTRAVLWLAAWLGIACELRVVDSTKGEHRAATFLRLNPNAKFPVLEDGALVLWESNAILRYLVARYGAGSRAAEQLYPSEPARRAPVDAWLDWKLSNIRLGAATVVRRRVIAKMGINYSQHSMVYDLAEIPEAREARILMESLALMEQQLASTAFIAGAEPTLADISLAVEVSQLLLLPQSEGPPFGGALNPQFPKVHAWFAKMRQQPGYDSSHKAFGGVVAAVDKMRKAAKL
jgi:glutathione S-transferase